MKIFSYSILFMILILGSCNYINNESKKNNQNKDSTSDSEFEIIVYTKYEIPLNIDLINFLYENNFDFDKEIINNPSNRQNYLTEISRAINLGIYTSDLAYSTLYSQSQLSLEYFDANRLIANDLGFTKGYDESYYQRMDENISIRDSLKSIAEESYWVACNYLDESDKNNILPFVVYGGWLETMHITVQLEQINDNQQILKKQILNQHLTVSNIIKYLYDVMIESSAFYFSQDIKSLIDELKIIEKLYKDYEQNQNEKIYNKIKSKIIEIRNLKVEMI